MGEHHCLDGWGAHVRHRADRVSDDGLLRNLGERQDRPAVPLGMHVKIWEFPEIRGTIFWGPYNKDPTT